MYKLLFLIFLFLPFFSYAKEINPYIGNPISINDPQFHTLSEAKKIIDDSLKTFLIIQQRENPRIFQELMKHSKGVLIIPSYYSGGVIVGGGHGTGLLLAKEKNSQWSYPAFYTMTGFSFGLQIGAQQTRVLIILLTNKGLDAVIKNSLTFGGTAGLSLWKIGSSVGGSTTTNAGADIVMFAVTNGGIFAGFTIAGASLLPNDKYNHIFYTEKANVHSIVFQGKYGNPAADKLRSVLYNSLQYKKENINPKK